MSATPAIATMLTDELRAALTRAQAQVNSLLLGKQQEVRLAFVALLSDGHLLIEDLPGLGKTTLAHALAATLGLGFQRVQFTSDLLPSDIVGVSGGVGVAVIDSDTQAWIGAADINQTGGNADAAALQSVYVGARNEVDITNEPTPWPLSTCAKRASCRAAASP